METEALLIVGGYNFPVAVRKQKGAGGKDVRLAGVPTTHHCLNDNQRKVILLSLGLGFPICKMNMLIVPQSIWKHILKHHGNLW